MGEGQLTATHPGGISEETSDVEEKEKWLRSGDYAGDSSALVLAELSAW